jgi:hypothetical protein
VGRADRRGEGGMETMDAALNTSKREGDAGIQGDEMERRER